MKKIIKITAILIAVAGSFACKDNNNEADKQSKAIIVDLGDPAIDGCGWAIQINDTINIPNFLDDKYKQDGLLVEIAYQNTIQVYNCPGFSSMKYPKIIIKQIKITQ
jgi:hypothetical protein